MTPSCGLDPSHRIHHSSIKCSDYAGLSDELKGHDENCFWEGFLSVKKCKCISLPKSELVQPAEAISKSASEPAQKVSPKPKFITPEKKK